MIRLLSYNLKTTLLLFSYSSNKAQPVFQQFGIALSYRSNHKSSLTLPKTNHYLLSTPAAIPSAII